MTFRSQLLQTILTLVGITTVAALVIVQRQNAAMFQRVVDRLFEEQMRIFRQTQELPLAAAKAEVERLAQSVRLFAALEEGDPEVVYQIAGDELRLGEFAFYRLLDGRGKLIPPSPGIQAGAFDDQNLTGEWLPRGDRGAEVSFGFVATKEGVVYRLLACGIRNFDETVGTLVLGQPMARETSILVDGKLIGEGIPDNLRRPLLAQRELSGRFEAGGAEYRFTRFRLNDGSTYPPADWVSVFSMADLTEQQRVLVFRIVATGIVALLAASGAAMKLSGQLAHPVASLVTAAQQVRQGNYQVSLPSARTQELRQLGVAFNEMASGLALRDRYHSVLQQVTDPRVAEELVAGRVKLGGELREVSILFCDIRGYTAMSAGRDPVEVIHFLNDHMGALTRIIQRHHGVINQFAGDAIMILFGAPKSYGDDSAHAVRCAWEMMQERERLNRHAPEPLRIGIGIATGKVVVGCIGGESRSDYTAVGEKVNLAARLCSAAVAGEIIVDEDTRSRTAMVAAFKGSELLTLKGFAQPVPAFQLKSLLAPGS